MIRDVRGKLLREVSVTILLTDVPSRVQPLANVTFPIRQVFTGLKEFRNEIQKKSKSTLRCRSCIDVVDGKPCLCGARSREGGYDSKRAYPFGSMRPLLSPKQMVLCQRTCAPCALRAWLRTRRLGCEKLVWQAKQVVQQT